MKSMLLSFFLCGLTSLSIGVSSLQLISVAYGLGSDIEERSQDHSQKRRVALVIGNAEYLHIDKLVNSERDARRLSLIHI